MAAPPPNYARFHRIDGWTEQTVAKLRKISDRPVAIREKGTSVRLIDDLADAHIVITHGSITAVEALVLGTPVCVDPASACAAVGITSLEKIETPVRPDREPWLRSLAYHQWSEGEMHDGTLWTMLED